ncbi:uroporphyrinogen decarboxylase [Candidatus Schmidhempelia bombi]|uniref:Uroporphyrinogen decarboxylase n=1 Tax=Candidatus Schmidhempelia bombi str. Bimp TaxID=1387197 RepID=A0AB94IBA7_9GAMM|nr:uroporphyrinogen decarboxylase [Candidatus Schmidhempelia bombi]TEA26689.1 uroporphyrinogen decarboxylase [Candidatus Schmidhempelia bombi str. Bimp]
MTMLQNDRYLRALRCQIVDRTPIWMMRQAGRYLPEYRALRAQAGSFMNLCQHPELTCEVTLQPLRRFPLDAAIIFSDILTIPDAMGLGLTFTAGEGPHFARPITSARDIQALPIPDPELELTYVMDAIRTTRRALQGQVPLIGFSGSPWTLATYMIEGGSSKTFSKIKKLMYAEPAQLHQLLAKLAQSVTLYLNAQIQAGAQSIMIFDTWGGLLSHESYRQFSLAYMQQIIDGLTRGNPDSTQITDYTPVTLFTKGGGLWLPQLAATGCDAIGVDWTVDLTQARATLAQVDKPIALQGNLDPAVLYATPDVIDQQVDKVLAEYGYGSGHVFNLGHGIMQDAPIEHVKHLVDTVQQKSKRYHQS